MADRIESALTPKQWAEGETDDGLMLINGELFDGDGRSISPSQTVALANAALKDDDRRKITPARLARLRATAEFQRQDYPPDMEAHREAEAALVFIDALASYLPPEAP